MSQTRLIFLVNEDLPSNNLIDPISSAASGNPRNVGWVGDMTAAGVAGLRVAGDGRGLTGGEGAAGNGETRAPGAWGAPGEAPAAAGGW
jgi:hypothetical protein